MEDERRPLRGVLRDAADPGLAPGAAERIADGAWARAAELRREAASRPTPRRLARRGAWPMAAAAVVVAGLVVAFRSTEPAFAVDGDPVQVLRGDDWERETARVPVGHWVFIPQGARTSVRGRDGAVIDPKPGAVFRITGAATSESGWRVELRSGDAEVAGRELVLTLSDAMEIAHTWHSPESATGHVVALHDAPRNAGGGVDPCVLRVAASFGAALDMPPRVGSAGTVADGAAGVRVLDGTARVANLRGADFMLLGPQQAATCIRVEDGDATGHGAPTVRLLRETSWSPDLAADILHGARVVGAAERGAGSVTIAFSFPGSDDRAVFVPQPFRREAFDQIGLLALQVAGTHAGLAAQHFGGANVRIDVRALGHGVGAAGDVRAEFEHVTADGARTTRIRVDGGGRATLETTDAAPRVFASLDDLRRDAPEAAALFGEKLR